MPMPSKCGTQLNPAGTNEIRNVILPLITSFIHFVHACPNVLPVIQSYFKHNSDLLKKQPIAALVLLFFKHVLIYHRVHSDLLFIYQSDIL